MTRAADAADGVASIRGLLVGSGAARGSRTTERAQRVYLDHRAIGGSAGAFLVPMAGRRAAVRPLLEYRRLRPWRPRIGRVVTAGLVGAGLGGLIGTRVTGVAGPDQPLLLDHLAEVLGVAGLRFAGTARPCRDFVTPVLQLLDADGRTVGFAKLGWDVVTDGMIRAEHDALDRVGRAGVPGLVVPTILWCGTWNGHAVLVTAPMPRDVARVRDGAVVPVGPLRDLAAVDAPMVVGPLGTSAYWERARATAVDASAAGDDAIAARVDRIEAAFGGVDLEFGRWHGDWVPWNLATDRGSLHAWDWAYSAPSVPFGFDAVHFAYLPRQVLGGMSPDAAAAAIPEAEAALGALGVPADRRPAVLALHRLEVELREVRARLARRGTDPIDGTQA